MAHTVKTASHSVSVSLSRPRLTALDGLRGFAALAVMLSHAGINSRLIWDSPIFHYFMRTIGAGSSAVQILFVLSGFLMAYLYPTITNVGQYWFKRYARIIPVYAVVVIYIWYSLWPGQQLTPLQHLLSLTFIASTVHIMWRTLGRWPLTRQRLGWTLFVTFVSTQLIYPLMSLTIIPLAQARGWLASDLMINRTLDMLDNLTLTTPLQRDVVMLSGVFWSLAPELLFYLIYPVVVIPMVRWARQGGWLITTLLTIVTIKFIFDLDAMSLGTLSLHTMMLGRTTGFVIGVAVGTLWPQWQVHPTWQKFWRHPLINVLFLALLSLMLAGEFGDAIHQVRSHMNYFYLLLSIVVGAVVMAAIQEKSLVQRLFQHKFLVALGWISYSLYLTHPHTMQVLHQADYLWHWSSWYGNGRVGELWSALVLSLGSIGVATLLFRLVEWLYFLSKKPSAETKITTIEASMIARNVWYRWRTPSLVATGWVIITAIYMSSYAPSLLLARHPLPRKWPWATSSITHTNPQTITFTALYPQLSVIIVGMDFVRHPQLEHTRLQDPELVFRLHDANGHLIIESRRHPQQVEGVPLFPFGFPAVADSERQQFTVTLSLERALATDQIVIKNNPNAFMTQYVTIKSMQADYLATILLQRLTFAWTHPGAVWALGLIGMLGWYERWGRKSTS